MTAPTHRSDASTTPVPGGSATTALRDRTGLTLTAAGDAAVAAWDAFLDDYAAFRTTLPERLEALFAADPQMPLAHSARAALLMLAGKGELLRAARSSAEAAMTAAVGATRRERLHAEAVSCWTRGDVAGACARWEFVLALEPTDLLALKLAQFAHFYGGDAEAMQRSVDGVRHAWTPDTPRYGYFLGVRAFALEEAGAVSDAEQTGREAVAREPDDAWAIHAVAHCLETRGDPRGGGAWLDALAHDWADAGTMNGHLRWHRALFALEEDGPQAVLERFDDDVRIPDSSEYLDLCNDVALLQRLELRGLDVGERHARIADLLQVRARDRVLPFCDVHWALGLAAAGRDEAADALLEEMRAAGRADRSDAAAYSMAATPLAAGMIAFRRGDAAAAVQALFHSRDHWHLVGGSRAQRDLFAQVLAASAQAAGETRLLGRLLAERARARGHERPWIAVA